RSGFLALILALACLSCSAAADVVIVDNVVADAVRFGRSGSPPPAFRGFWADAFHQGFKSTSQIDAMVARAVEGNYNTIVAEVLAYQDNVGGGHGAYWNSSIVPKATDIAGGIDPLAYLVQEAHAVGIEVEAWLVSFRVCTTWPPSGNSLLAAHPEWLMVPQADMGGGPAKVAGKYTLDPGSPEVQEYLVGIVRELVTNYQIDGINWDYIRYVQTDAGYPADASYTLSSLARFQQITGYVGTPAPSGVTSWNDFRRRTIDELVRRCRAEIASISGNPRQPVRQTADLICFGNAPASFTSSDAYLLHQNWQHWMQQGWLDAGMPMNYKREHVAAQAVWYRNWIDAALLWRYDRHMYCGQAPYLNSMANSVQQMAYALDHGVDGTMNYSYYATADENLDGNWENNWGWYGYVAGNLFLDPAPLPEMPWRDPALAVEGTLWGRITELETGDPIDDATVQVGGVGPVRTDGNGYYVVTLLPAVATGTLYDVTVSAAGFPDLIDVGVPVFAGDVYRRDIGICTTGAGPGDMDDNCRIDLADLPLFVFCVQGPDADYQPGHFCLSGDADFDLDVDLEDFGAFQRNLTTP
ncbi:MAG: family 10 glycosylhydrolase, partial [Planctomycetes bacterium]|nr:family 10 glycosylhydrolase [Planctomycetota bacterium]